MRKRNTVRARRGEQGMALVVALLILLALTALGTALMITVNTETKIAGNQLRDSQCLAIAEGGIQEAMLRLRTGDVPDNLNKRQVTLIYEAPSGSIPVSGTDTTSLASMQPSGSYLGYAGSSKARIQGSSTDLRVLTVRYKTKITPGSPPDTQIVRYDDLANPKFNTNTGTAVFQIVSTGTKGSASRSVVAEVTRAKFNILARGALVAKVAIQFKGNIKVCGHDHLYTTPINTQPPACDVGMGQWWASTAHASCMPGGWSESSITEKGSSTVIGEPSAKSENQTGFYSGPWDALGMAQTDFWPWVGNPQSGVVGTPKGIYYLDNDGVKQNQSGDWSFNGGDGDGLIYCDGDLHLNGSFTFKGMIYCEGNLDVNGNCWILGGIVVHGKTLVKIANGSATILYSSDAIQQSLSKYGGNIRLLSWREF